MQQTRSREATAVSSDCRRVSVSLHLPRLAMAGASLLHRHAYFWKLSLLLSWRMEAPQETPREMACPLPGERLFAAEGGGVRSS